jgi:hypothetical protein
MLLSYRHELLKGCIRVGCLKSQSVNGVLDVTERSCLHSLGRMASPTNRISTEAPRVDSSLTRLTHCTSTTLVRVGA